MKPKDARYTIEELVAIGDHIHNSTTALIICDVPEKDGEHTTTMATANGKRKDLVMMVYAVLKKQPFIESVLCEAIMLKKMQDISVMFDNIPNRDNEE
jgi:hypothetical protein